ncbi:MAG: haloacid dehalogenase type II [Burkholderiales bacterium]|nr:haloacid dehalogenase type II [Burkholderiales bacterium]
MDIKALAFDTGGTILDWHAGICTALAAAGGARGLAADWHAVTNDYRRRSLQAIVGQVHPAFNFDDVHRRVLDEVIAHFGLDALTEADRDAIWRTWHALDAWPGFADALARLRSRFIVASFTLLTPRLVVDVSRRNGLAWDAVISCEMIGHYKTRPEAYLTAARWLQLPPAQILMVACHNFDLDAARACGYKTAFVRRPAEWGPGGPPDPVPNPANEVIVDDFDALARALGA